MNAWQERRRKGVVGVGHRGAAALAPQNTLRAFARALALGVDAVELDVRWTADRHLVVIHDEDVSRSTTGSGFVSRMTLAALRALDAGEGERVPTLDEAFVALRGRALVLVDLKVAGYEEQVVRAISDHRLDGDVCVCSLIAGSLRRVHALAPGLFTAFSYPEDTGGASKKRYLQPVVSAVLAAMRTSLPWRIGGMMNAAQASGTMLYHRLLTPAAVRAVHRAGKWLGAWTVDRPDDIARMRALGVDSITSNHPDLLV